MTKKLNLDTLHVYSTDVERVSNAIKRVIRFSDAEEKLFGCFDWCRENAKSNDKTLWDRNFNQLVNRELGRMNISQDFTTKLRARLDADIEDYRRQYSEQATGIDDYTLYAQMVRAGHDEVVIVGNILDTIWKHQEKLLNSNTNLTKLNQQDRTLDFARYMESRAKSFQIEEDQGQLKRSLDAPCAKARKNAAKRDKEKARKKKKNQEADPEEA